MISGYHCACESCEFEFCSGHSHHVGASNAICLTCEARYCLPTKSCWGPAFDEFVELHANRTEPLKQRQRGRKKHLPLFKEIREPTGQQVLTVRIPVEGWPHARYEFAGVDELECTTCKSKGRIVLGFNQGDACPRCKTGKLKCEELEY